MRSKVRSLLELAKVTGVECEILDISKAGNLEDALNGKKGTGTIIRRA
jgi:isopentenyl phosphate kinase